MKMEVVYAKHLDSDKEFLFRCEGQPVGKGECLIVDTNFGKSLAIATSNREECSPFIAQKLGAYLPLKSVLLVVTKEYADLVIKAAHGDLIKKKEYGNLPF